MSFEAATLSEDQFGALPDPLKAQFEKGEDGAYIQRDPGAAPAKALEAERENAKKLNKELGALREKIKTAPDPEKYAELQAKLAEIEETKLKQEGNHAELHKRQLESLREAKEAEIAELSKKLEGVSAQLEKVLIEDRGVSAVASVEGFDGEKPGNMTLLKLLLRETLRLHDGQPTPFDGDQPLLVEGRPMTLEEWAKQLPKTHPGFFRPSTGGGATNATKSGGTPINSKPLKDWKADEKSAFIRENGIDKWTELVRSTYGNGALPPGA